MTSRPNHSAEREYREPGLQMFETAISWQQQALKASLLSAEMMRASMHHIQRQLDYLNMLTDSLSTVGKLNAEFLQHAADDAAKDWSKTAGIAATWAREAGEQTAETARARH